MMDCNTANPRLYCDTCGRDPSVVQSQPSTICLRKRQEDTKKYDVVKATQYGALDKVKEIIKNGFDVNQRDEENITLLHWASINNRKEIVQYLIKKGSVIDAVGGELMSTPLHWAARRGHLQVMIKLLQYGADSNLRDGEGYAAIHLAAQFGHSAILGYLIAKGQNVNTPDNKGMTPLMWSSYRTQSIDPVRFLVALGSSLTFQDTRHGNTALHWAIIAKNINPTFILVDKLGNSGVMSVKNNLGEMPVDLLPKESRSWLPWHIGIKIIEGAKVDRRWVSPVRRIQKNPKFREILMMMMPFILFWGIWFMLDAPVNYLGKLGMLVLLCFIINCCGVFFDDRFVNFLPIGIFISTKLWLYYTWFLYVQLFVAPKTTALFMIVSLGLWYNFIKVWKSDPGTVRTSQDMKFRTIIELAEKDRQEPIVFCSSCLVRCPVRSEHCDVCDRCVAKFDHHSRWVGNCIGEKNHKYFLGYLFFLGGLATFSSWGCLVHLGNACVTSDDLTWWAYVKSSCLCSPWVVFMLLIQMYHLTWVICLATWQMYLVVILGMTTNERMNLQRYKHFPEGPRGYHLSPFDKGAWQNFVDFTGWECAGILRPNRIDWANKFEADEFQGTRTHSSALKYMS